MAIKIRGIFLIVSMVASVESMGSPSARELRVKEARKELGQGIFEVRELLRGGALTKTDVEDKICKVPFEDGTMLLHFAKEIKEIVFIAADTVIKKGKKATSQEIENAVAGLGILRWSGLELLGIRTIDIRLSALLRLSSNELKKRGKTYETSI